MGSMSIIHWIILGAVLLLFFGGRNKISDVMGDVAKGIKSFKKGLADDDEPKPVVRPAEPVHTLDHYQQPVTAPVSHPGSQPLSDTASEPRKVG
jgi:sec-independent protein translocase protein TatA